jgi:adenylate cyclase
VDDAYSGVEIHATVLDNLLANDFVAAIPHEATLGYALLAALLCSIAVRSSNRVWKTVLILLFLVPVPALLCVAAYEYNIWAPFVLPETGVVAAFMITIVVKYAVEGRKKRFIKSAFSQYMSHEVVEELLKNPDMLKLGGEKKVLSIFFSDLEGFTGISEGMEPEELTEWLNRYLSAMSDIIKEEGGTIDKYEGDAIIAFWNAPLPQQDHASRAVRAALKCQQKLSDIGLDLRKKAGTDVSMRIGLHTGPVVVGNMGSRSRFDYTIVGDAANLASRLEGLNKHFGTRTLISEDTLEHVKREVSVREVSTVAVKGKTKPVKVFEPMSKLEFAKRRYIIRNFGQGLNKYYEGDFREAHRLFSHTKDRDRTAKWYAALCEELMKNPPEDWDGVWVMGEK